MLVCMAESLRSIQTCRVLVTTTPICYLPPLSVLSCQAVCGVLVGVQQGAVVQPGSGAAIAINSLLLLTKVAYATYLTCIRPQVSVGWRRGHILVNRASGA